MPIPQAGFQSALCRIIKHRDDADTEVLLFGGVAWSKGLTKSFCDLLGSVSWEGQSSGLAQERRKGCAWRHIPSVGRQDVEDTRRHGEREEVTTRRVIDPLHDTHRGFFGADHRANTRCPVRRVWLSIGQVNEASRLIIGGPVW